ncbi:MAG: hypothetical protein NTX03_09840 [Bacteroidetes bacterium]|nr:hypothetical protein [Bacteroidota bacterium]
MKSIESFVTEMDILPYIVGSIVLFFSIIGVFFLLKKDWKNVKRTIAIGVLTGALVGGFVFYEVTRDATKLSADSKADFSVEAMALGKEFAADMANSGAKYKDKVVEVKGAVESIDKDKTNAYSVIMKTEGGIIQCAVLPASNETAATVKAGDNITMKGKFTASDKDDIDGLKLFLVEGIISK